jgi:hypothetical protein
MVIILVLRLLNASPQGRALELKNLVLSSMSRANIFEKPIQTRRKGEGKTRKTVLSRDPCLKMFEKEENEKDGKRGESVGEKPV